VRISELESVRGRFGLPVERDRSFIASHTLTTYARAAWNACCITENLQALQQAAEATIKEGAS
jgi:hypothetical protein